MAIMSPGLVPPDQNTNYFPPAPSKALFPLFSTDPNSKITPQLLTALGAGLLSGNTWNEQLANAGLGANTAVAAQLAKQKEDAIKNQTVAALQPYPDLANAVSTGALTPTAAYGELLKRKQQEAEDAKPKYQVIGGKLIQTNAPDGIKVAGDFSEPKNNLMNLGKGLIYDPVAGKYITPPPGTVDNETEYGVTPVWFVDKDGNKRIGLPGKNGTLKVLDNPDGMTPLPGVSNVDMGTSTGLIDKRTGETVRTVPKDLAGAEQQKAEGKLTGEAVKALPATLAKASDAIATIDNALKNTEGLKNSAGWQSVFPTMPGSKSADFQATLSKIKGSAFLQAYQDLRGTGAISEAEGAKAENAIAALSLSQSDAQLRQALVDLKGIISAGMERAKLLAQNPNTPQSLNDAAMTPDLTNDPMGLRKP